MKNLYNQIQRMLEREYQRKGLNKGDSIQVKVNVNDYTEEEIDKTLEQLESEGYSYEYDFLDNNNKENVYIYY